MQIKHAIKNKNFALLNEKNAQILVKIKYPISKSKGYINFAFNILSCGKDL